MYSEIARQAIKGKRFAPVVSKSRRFKHWLACLDFKICIPCKKEHGKIFEKNSVPDKEPPLHANCRCQICTMDAIRAGTATVYGINGADWSIKQLNVLPEHYITKQTAIQQGWKPHLGDLGDVLPGKMIGGDVYSNRNGLLPIQDGRTWFEADIHYESGFRTGSRLLYSNDGLVFVTYDHYKTFYEIV